MVNLVGKSALGHSRRSFHHAVTSGSPRTTDTVPAGHPLQSFATPWWNRLLSALQALRAAFIGGAAMACSSASSPLSSYRLSSESSNRANSAAGPGYTSTQPASRSEASVNPPHSTPMVAMSAFPAADAS
jgi:hypothetical protein